MRFDLSARLLWLAVAGLAAGVGAAWIVSMAGPGRPAVPDVPLAVPVAILVGWSFIGSGLLSWQPGQRNRLGLVLVFTGFAWFASMLSDAPNPVLFTAGQVLYPIFYAGFLYLVLSFPSGRLRGRLDRALMVVTIRLVVVVNPAVLLLADSHMLCRNCPANLLEVARVDAVMMGLIYLVRIGGIAVALTTIGLLIVRWRRASRPQRRAVMPVVVAGAVAFAVLIASYGAAVLGAAMTVARRCRSPSRPLTWAGTRSKSRPPCTSASWKRSRTPRNTRTPQQPT
jgi:hypothetical protein